MFLSKTVDEESESEYGNLFEINELLMNFPKKNFVAELNETVLKDVEEDKLNKNKNRVALKLNQNTQKKLLEIRTELELILKKCKEKYQKNDVFLNELHTQSTQQLKIFSRYSYNYCGLPYFKDLNGFGAPPNTDYLNRVNLKEFFPVDMLKKTTIWTLNDKIAILNEIKDQVTNFLKENAKINEFSLKNTRSRQCRISEIYEKYDEMTLKELLNCDINESFNINWYRICLALEHRHSEISCEAMWILYLHPKLNRSAWTEDEDKLLLKLAKNYNYQNWSKIAEEVGYRSEFQCFIRYSTMMVQLNKKSQKWSKSEDDLLLHAVECSRMNNKICWNLVQHYLPERDKKSLITRYSYSLDPNIIKGSFTPEEDCILLGAIEEYGENFSLIPLSLFPGRTSVQLRNRYRNSLKYVNKHQHWSIEDDRKLMDWVKINGTNKWSELAKIFGYHNRCSVRQRYGTITKFLKKNPNADFTKLPRKNRKQNSKISKENWVENFKQLSNKTLNNISENENNFSQLEYINRLRSVQKDYYHFFKYSYDFEYKIKSSNFYAPIKNINFLTNLFSIEIRKEVLGSLPQNIFNKIESNFLKEIVSKYSQPKLETDLNILLPPNWSNLVGFRAICIQCATTSEPTTIKKATKMVSNSGAKAKEIFKKRFRSIFYNTMLLTRLNVLQHNNSKEINIDVILETSEISQTKNFTSNNEEIEENVENLNTSSEINLEDVIYTMDLNEDYKNIQVNLENNRKHYLNESDGEVVHKNKVLKIESS